MSKSTFLQDFKAFAVKGNAIDMAVGVIIGGAFGKIVTSIVNDLIMPPIGWIIGGVDFKDLKFELPINPLSIKEGIEPVPVTINYGNFIQTTLDFIIIAFCVFLLVRLIMKLSKKKEEAKPATPPVPPAPSKEEVLLTEIRDLLKEKK
jgi:large conductance mechanosensitive channel